MINYEQLKKYCCEDPRLIENYEAAKNDKNQTWHIHHRLETDENISMNELIKQKRYYNRPASELIFLTKAEHCKIHMEGEKNPMYGKETPLETRKKQSESKLGKHPSEETRKKQSESMKGKNKGKNNPMYSKNIKDYMTEEAYNKWLELHKGKNNHHYGKTGEKSYSFGHCWMNNGIDEIFPKKENANKYIELGYNFGRK